MFVLASALDRSWYSDLINKINPDLIIGCTYKSYPALAYDIIYVRYVKVVSYITGVTSYLWVFFFSSRTYTIPDADLTLTLLLPLPLPLHVPLPLPLPLAYPYSLSTTTNNNPGS